MRALPLTGTVTDLGASPQKAPFMSNYTVVALNVTAGNLVLQDSDDNVTFGTLATVIPGAQEVMLRKRYIKVSTAAGVTLLGN